MMGNKKSKKISFWIWDPYIKTRDPETSGSLVSGSHVSGSLVSGSHVSGSLVSGSHVSGSLVSGFLSLMSLFLWLLSLVSYIFLGSYFLVPITVDDNIYFRREVKR